MIRLTKRQIQLLVVGIVALLTIFLWMSFSQREVVEVEVVKVERGSIESIVSAPGIVSSSNIDVLIALIDGEISKLNVFLGKQVKKDEFLCIIENPEVRARVLQAEVDLNIAKESLDKAKSEEDKAAAKNRYEIAKDNYELGRSVRVISSKINGEIVDIKIKDGQPIARGMELFKIADLSRLELIAKVSESDASNIRVGQQVTIGETMYKDIKFKGAVIEVDKIIEQTMGVSFLQVTCSIQNISGYALKLGSYADAEILTSRKLNVLRVPKEAILVEEGNITKVYTAKDGKAHLITITTGINGEDFVEVKSGLKDSDLVITQGKFDLSEDKTIVFKNKII